jgi:predicted amidohydrolase YtcJ
MRMLRRCYLIAVLLGLAAPCACGAEPAADRVLVNGNILTVDASDSVAQAVAIGGGRIVGVGTNSEIEAFTGPATDRIDLQGRTVTPGLLDAHLHLSSGGLSRITEADLSFPLVKSVGDAGKMRGAIAAMADELNRECMTGAKDPGIGYSLTYDPDGATATWNAYREVLAAGDLSVRVFALWRSPDTLDEARQLAARIAPFTRPMASTGDDRLISGGVKIIADGSGDARTAWMWQDWNRERTGLDQGNRGYPAIDAGVLRDLIMLYHDAGLHVGVHAVGDRAIDWTVAAMTVALIRNPRRGMRHSIIHASIPTDLALDTIAALQQNFDAGYPEPQANFTWWVGDTYAGNFGVQRSRRLNPFRSFQKRGIQWAGGSDYSATPFPARYGIWSSMARQPLLGFYGNDTFGSDEAIDVRTALRSFTLWAAHQMFLDKKVGSIEVGKYADLAVWDTDLYTAEPGAIKNMQCQMTLLQGEIVYRR